MLLLVLKVVTPPPHIAMAEYFTGAQMEQFKTVFNQFDTNGDGNITYKVLKLPNLFTNFN